MATSAAAAAGADVSAFRKLDHREHVLQRPGMYIGSVVSEPGAFWVLGGGGSGGGSDSGGGGGGGKRVMELRPMARVPGLLQIVDEVLVNAVDHCTRLKQLAARA